MFQFPLGRQRWHGVAWALLLAGLLLLGVACTSNKSDDEVQVAVGRNLYLANCAACHGQQGEGAPNWQMPLPDGRYQPPPHDSTGHTWHHGDLLLFGYVKEGAASLQIQGFVSGLPAFGQTRSDDEIKAVLLYLKSLWGTKERSFQAEVSEQEPSP